jgi:N-ethylmaleimide reductase
MNHMVQKKTQVTRIKDARTKGSKNEKIMTTTSDRQPLLKPIKLGDLELKNRVFMAPLTRTRARNAEHVPTDLMLQYYEQRATSGLIFTEGTFVSENAQGWYGVPGIYTEKQGLAWQKITDAVHKKGGKIFLQLWHTGGVSRPELRDGLPPLAPSALDLGQQVHSVYGVEMSVTNREMSLKDIKDTIAEFAHAAKTAKDAGFDGVQLQTGYVYLIQQFLHDLTNRRTDEYGGKLANRARFLFEALEAILEIWPSERVGVKAGPMMNEHGLLKATDTTLEASEYVAQKLNEYQLSHLLIMRQMADLTNTPIAHMAGDAILHHLRKIYKGQIIANVGITIESGNALIESGVADAVAFGREYIANPDLVERIRSNAPLNPQRPEGFYGESAEGYTDYPFLEKSKTLFQESDVAQAHVKL